MINNLFQIFQMVGICVQELTDAYFDFEEEKARWASLEDNHDGECQGLGQEITKLHNQLEQVHHVMSIK